MLKLKTIIPFVILLLLVLSVSSYAVPVEWTSGNYVISANSEWDQIPELITRNDVTVTMPGPGGGVGWFWMHDDSELTMRSGSVAYLYLYENTKTTLFNKDGPMELYIDPSPTNTSLVTLYAEFDRFEPFGPNGRGYVYGNWLSNGNPFSINLVSDGAYSKVQFIPEPATLILLGLGSLAMLRRLKQ